ncbi:hypothetical protein CEXT_155691 [Caerostris extrusa]|uniref:Uncharacterized protein n=1 Tax=Caerostris extrusa TaxID=172846 RepID=A0AAV4MPY4_CAEEX|nr:hypothetical protein CEXT_155691 [Caerostris extrusa]
MYVYRREKSLQRKGRVIKRKGLQCRAKIDLVKFNDNVPFSSLLLITLVVTVKENVKDNQILFCVGKLVKLECNYSNTKSISVHGDLVAKNEISLFTKMNICLNSPGNVVLVSLKPSTSSNV